MRIAACMGLATTLICLPLLGGESRYLCVIVIDANRPDYFDLTDVPNVRRLMSEGVSYDRAWVGSLRNDTPAQHVTIGTGCFPRRHGVIGFAWRDPATGQITRPTGYQKVTDGTFTRLIASAGCPSLAKAIKQAYPGSLAAGFSSEKFYAAAGLTADAPDRVLYCFYNPGSTPPLGATVGYLLKPTGVTGYLAPSTIMNSQDLQQTVVNFWDGDTWTVDLALKVFNLERPRVMLVNLALTDNAGHIYGGIVDPEHLAPVIANVDVQIGRLLAAYETAGLYDQTLFVVTSDHGMSHNENLINDAAIQSAGVEFGMTVTEAARTEYYLPNLASALACAEKITQLRQKGVRAVYYKVAAGGSGYAYLPAPTTQAEIGPALDACYRYLTSTYASPQSPEIVFFPFDSWNVSAGFYYEGDHGGATWDVQHVPLILAGQGLRSGVVSHAPVRLVDIAPTVLAAMGLPTAGMDGVVLADALSAPTADQLAAQDAVNAQQQPLRDALAGIPVRPPQQITDFTFTRDYRPGTVDANGQLLAGQELMRLIAWQGELFASTSTFTDPIGTGGDPRYTGCQVLRKAGSGADWVADATFGKRYLRTDTLQPVRFTRDADGNPLPASVEMLVAGIWDIGELMPGGARYITLAVRNDAARTWTISRGPYIPVEEKGFASVRCFWVHTDKVTGREYLFVGAACGGIYKVVYDPVQPGNLRWLQGDEVDATYGRAHSMCIANGSLYVSFDYGGLTVQNQTGGIYLRHDGEAPTWERVYYNYNPNNATWNQTARGITAIPAEDGSGGEVILAGVEQPPQPIIVRIEPHRNHQAVTELNYATYMRTNVFGGRNPMMIDATLAAAVNYFDPFVNPQTGRTEHFVTLVLYHPDDPAPGVNGAWYLVRRSAEVYDWGYVPFIPFDVPPNAINHLRGLRTVCRSPFPDEPKVYYFGGCFNGPSEQPPKSFMVWIYKGIPTRPPTCSITSPANGAAFTAPATIMIQANASDSDGSVSKVEFYQGTAKLGEDTTSPYTFTWSNVPAGSYTLTAKATDNQGADTISQPVTIAVAGEYEVEVPLAAGYTLIALPLVPAAPLTAEEIAQQINAQSGTCTSVIAYDAAAGAFVTHPAGTAVSNFDIEIGKGYFVRCAAASTWRARGLRLIALSGEVTLKAGYNLIGLPVEPSIPGKYTAESAAIEMNAQFGGATQIIRYDETTGQFVTHPVGTAVANFPLKPGRGYFVRCTKDSVWTVSR